MNYLNRKIVIDWIQIWNNNKIRLMIKAYLIFKRQNILIWIIMMIRLLREINNLMMKISKYKIKLVIIKVLMIKKIQVNLRKV